jgi:hypothetical protein
MMMNADQQRREQEGGGTNPGRTDRPNEPGRTGGTERTGDSDREKTGGGKPDGGKPDGGKKSGGGNR